MIVLSLFTFGSLSLSVCLSLFPCRTNRNLQPIDVNHRAANSGSPKPRHKRGSSSVSIQTTSSKDSSSTVTSSNSTKASTISLRQHHTAQTTVIHAQVYITVCLQIFKFSLLLRTFYVPLSVYYYFQHFDLHLHHMYCVT